jgi:hypothetical protein
MLKGIPACMGLVLLSLDQYSQDVPLDMTSMVQGVHKYVISNFLSARTNSIKQAASMIAPDMTGFHTGNRPRSVRGNLQRLILEGSRRNAWSYDCTTRRMDLQRSTFLLSAANMYSYTSASELWCQRVQGLVNCFDVYFLV